MRSWISHVSIGAAANGPHTMRAAALVALVLAALAAPHTARAQTADVVCAAGTYSVTISPRLTNTSQSFTFTGSGTLTGYVSTDLTFSALATQTFTFSGSGTGGCTGVSASLSATATWNNGRTSTGTGAFTLTVVGGIPKASDPRVFTEPYKLDLARTRSPHLTFGAGIHHCLGSWLARVEHQEALRAFLLGLPDTVHTATDPSTLRFKQQLILRSLAELPIAR